MFGLQAWQVRLIVAILAAVELGVDIIGLIFTGNSIDVRVQQIVLTVVAIVTFVWFVVGCIGSFYRAHELHAAAAGGGGAAPAVVPMRRLVNLAFWCAAGALVALGMLIVLWVPMGMSREDLLQSLRNLIVAVLVIDLVVAFWTILRR